MEISLKICPFCGNIPEIKKGWGGDYWVLTHDCEIIGPLEIYEADLKDIEKRWNLRKGA